MWREWEAVPEIGSIEPERLYQPGVEIRVLMSGDRNENKERDDRKTALSADRLLPF
jgi:hypothetical protein